MYELYFSTPLFYFCAFETRKCRKKGDTALKRRTRNCVGLWASGRQHLCIRPLFLKRREPEMVYRSNLRHRPSTNGRQLSTGTQNSPAATKTETETRGRKKKWFPRRIVKADITAAETFARVYVRSAHTPSRVQDDSFFSSRFDPLLFAELFECDRLYRLRPSSTLTKHDSESAKDTR